MSKNLFFGKLWLLRKEAEWRFVRPKAYKGTSMGEKTSNKRKYIYQFSVIFLRKCHLLFKGGYEDLSLCFFVYVSATLSAVKTTRFQAGGFDWLYLKNSNGIGGQCSVAALTIKSSASFTRVLTASGMGISATGFLLFIGEIAS